ncbi:MAG: neuraminidase-like domain-containing protein [Methanothrix sp.]|nr:neuraminidase-like domain-containing protein [Methanothrix sp.]
MSCEEEIEVVEIKACESLDRFKEFYPEFNSVNKILNRYPISSCGENRFVHQFADELEGGSREARQIYRTAADISEKAALIWANIKDAIAPYYGQVIFNNLPDSFLNKLRSIPAYDRLFGSLDYINCDHCRSIFGPAAYFADLMRFAETYITDENTDTIPTNCVLDYRRPDLGKMRLDCSNSTDIIASIDLVNELLQAFLETTGNYADAYKLAKDAIFPQSLPFNSPREEIQSYLQIYETSLWQIYQAFNRPFVDKLFENKIEGQIAREFLQLSPEDFHLITSEISSQNISGYFGEVDLAGIDGLENVDVLLEQMKLTREELNELVSQNLDRHEINAGLSRLFFINSADDGLGTLAISSQEGIGYDKLQNLSPAKLDRMYRFLKLSRKLNWSFADLDWSLRSLCQPYLPERGLKFDGIDDYISCRNADKLDLLSLPEFTIEAWISLDSAASHAAFGLLINRTLEQYHLCLGVNPSGKLVFCIFRIISGPDEKAESEKIFEIESYYDSIANGIFTHVAVSYANGMVCLFINGKKVLINKENDSEKPFIKPASNSPLRCIDMTLGRDLFDNYFYGIIKEVRIWQKARDETALQEDRYKRFTGRESDLIGYWPLIEGLWDYLPDMTPGGSQGVLGGGEFSAQPKWVYRELILDPLPEAEMGCLLRFDGQDHYLAARGFRLSDTDRITIEAQIKVEERPGVARRDDYILCLGEDGQNAKVALYSSAQGKLVFKLCPEPEPNYNPITLTSSASLPQGRSTHVCVTLDKNTVKFYINGIESNLIATQYVNINIENGFLNVGRSFDGENGGDYFCGMIKELRIWSRARTGVEINSYLYRKVPPSSAGLVGYWRFDEVAEGKAGDLTGNEFDLCLGGILNDYSPSFSATEILPRPEVLPVPAAGTVLQFDGDNDVIVIKNPENRGLGRYERLTVELWFNASAHGDSRRKQVLFSQGDAEAGLCIYLYNGLLFILEWNNSLENIAQNIPPQSKSLFKIPFTDYGNWHHIALTQNEFPHPIPEKAGFPLDNCFYREANIELRAYLDAAPLLNASGNDVCSGYKLCPVGPIYLGGLGRKGKSCFDDAYSDRNNVYFFAGQIANLGIWNLVKSANESRYFAPPATKDLIAYLPLDEGEGWCVRGWGEKNLHMGTLQDRNIGLVCKQLDAELINIYSHYFSGPGALSWSNYCLSGRMQIKEKNASIGVTFYSRHIEGIDQCYLLGRDANQKTFHLFAHPSGVQEIKSSNPAVDLRDTGIDPQSNVWYHFLIRVETTATQINIKAKIWPENEAMPDAFQVDACDDSSIRINSGTVGLWTTGTVATQRQFDNLRVWPASIVDPLPSDLLLDINFEAESQMPEPDLWLDGEDRQKLALPGGLFKQINVSGGAPGETAFGTDSEDINIHSYFSPAGSDELSWNNYQFQGRMRISDRDSGIGVIFFSRQPEGIDQYYGLTRDAKHRTFHLIAHPQDVQKVKSFDLSIDRMDSGIEPLPNVWYNFLLEVYDTGSETRIRAKIWPESEIASSVYVIDALDDSDIRIKSGAMGVWASGTGSKYFRHLKVHRDFKIYENFDSYSSGQDPLNWRDTKANSSNAEDNSLFKTYALQGRTVFGTRSQANNIHTHYVGGGARDWKNYIFAGCLRIGDPSDTRFGSIGVTLLSQYFSGQSNHNRYYKLINSSNLGFVLLTASNAPLLGAFISNLIPQANTWYRFLIVVEDTGSRTNVRAKIWPESGTEPTNYQINAYDAAGTRLISGTVGFLTMGSGSKYFKDLSVFTRQHPLDSTIPENWHDLTMRTSERGTSVDDLFKTVDLLDNTPHWVALPSMDNNYYYPVLLRPLSLTSLDFDGKQMYLAASGYGEVTPGQFALEAWICPSKIKESIIISMAGKDSDGKDIILAFGMDSSGNLKLSQKQGDLTTILAASQGVVLEISKFCHVALSTKGNGLAFFINGAEVGSNVQTLGLLNSAGLHIERADIGKDIDNDYFAGRIKEVRIWDTQRSLEDIRLSMYQKAALSNNLLAYWSLGEEEGGLVSDLSDKGNHMRKGGLAEDRSPTLIDVALLGFWRPQRRALNFNGTINYAYDRANEVVSRCTIEVWFRVEDKTISRHKQVIYQEGDDQCGLAIYIFDSSLYLGGYNLLCGWQGTWLHSDRIESGRWHHAAIVLDGRAEVRDESLQVYLDGKLMDSGPASQIEGAIVSFSLGGLHSLIRFHDGLYEGSSGHMLCGQILCLRMWNSARIGVQISSNLYSEPGSAGLEQMQRADLVHWELDHSDYTWEPVLCREIMRLRKIPDDELPGLDLWWESDVVDPSARIIIDQSGKGHNGAYAAEQLQAIQLPAIYELPVVSIDAKALQGIAIIKLLMERSSLANDRLTALWYVLKHVGNDDDSPLFDRIFNPEGTAIEPWDYYLDESMRWDKSGQEDRKRDSRIRSRLMGAMHLSDADLNLIVEYLSGKDEVIIELDYKYLGQVYQLSQLARMLNLSVADLLNLLLLQGGVPNSLLDILKISNVAEWLSSSGLCVADLVYFACHTHDPDNANVSLYSADDIRSLADSVFRQFAGSVVTGKTFQSDQIREALSSDIFTFLSSHGIVTSIGAVSQTYYNGLDLSDLLIELADIENWMSEFEVLKAEFDQIRAGLGNEILGRLQSHGFINQFGLVLEKEDGYGTDSLMTIFDGQNPDQRIRDMLPRVTEILVQRKAFQELLLDADGPIRTALKGSQESLNNILLSELAGLFDVPKEVILPIVEYLGSDGGQDFDQLLTDLNALLPPGSEMSPGLEIELFKISKLIHLAGAFELTAEEMSLLLSYPQRFSVSDLLQPSLLDLHNLYNYKQLQSAFSDTEGLLDYLLSLPSTGTSADTSAIEEAIDDLAGWEPQQLRRLVSYLQALKYNSIPGLCRLKECFDIAQAMQAGIDLSLQLADTSALTSQDGYDFYSRKAAELLEVLRAAYTEEEWPDIIKPIHDQLAVLRRDALLALALQKLPEYWHEYLFCWSDAADKDIDQLKIFLGRTLHLDFVEDAEVKWLDPLVMPDTLQIGPDNGEHVTIAITKQATATEDGTALLTSSDGLTLDLIVKLDDLANINVYRQNRFRKGPDIYHEYFLMDLQVGAEMETSRIVQATAALQFYIQRCLMNLEPGVDPATISLLEWEWVKNYRVWEANRKVFLYPENYIEPELRDTKTPFFEDLEQELMQSDISQDSAESAYVHYLEKFAEVANLKIVGSYLHVDLEDPTRRWETLYLVGRTNTEPKIFYQRVRIKDENGERWLAWKKIDLVINSDFVTPVYAFGKLFLFWTEFTKLKKGVGNSGETEDVYNTSLKYSYFNFSQEWKPPQSWVELDNELTSEEHEQIRWQRIYAQRIVDLSLPDNTSQPEVEEDAMVLQIDEATYLVKTVTSFDMNNLTWEFWAKFINANPDGWSAPKTTTRSEEDEKAALVRSCILIGYDNGKFKVEAKNKIAKIPGYQERVQASTYVADKTEIALNEISNGNFSAGSGHEDEAKSKALDVVFENHEGIAALALAAKNSSDNAAQKASQAQAARTAADFAWTKYNETGITEEEKQIRLTTFNQLNEIANAAEQDAAFAKADAINKANDANNAAIAARDAELAKPKWESTAVIVSIKAWNHTSYDIEFGFDDWQHIAITLQKTGTGYDLWANDLDKVALTEQNVLPAGGTIVIGSQEAKVCDAFIAQMSEMRLWDHIRDKAIIEAEKDQRKRKETGLFCLPLNVIEAGSRMNLVKSVGFDFIIPAAFNGNVLSRIANRERLILFYGDKIASLRNNLKDQSFQLIIDLQADQNIYDVCLKAEANTAASPKAFLMLTETKGLSLKDYAEGIDEEVRSAPTSLAGNYLVRNLEIKESYLADIGNQHGWYIANLGDEEFLVKMLPFSQDIPTTEELLKVKYGNADNQDGEPQVISIYLDLAKIGTLVVPSQLKKSFLLGSNQINAVAISSDGPIAGYISEYGKLMTQNLQSQSSPTALASGSYRTTAVAMTPDCRYAVSVESSQWQWIYWDPTVFKIWDMEDADNNRVLAIIDPTPDQTIRLLALTTDCSKAVSISGYGTARLWNLVDGQSPLAEKNIYQQINAVAVAIKNSQQVMVVLGLENGTLKLWNPLNGNVQDFKGRHSGPIRAVAITPDGSKAISASADNTIKFWDLGTGSVIRTLVGHTDEVVAVAMTPDGTKAISGSLDGLVKAWNLESGLFLRNLEGHTGPVSALAVTSNYTRGASVSKDGTLKIWDLTGLDANNIKFSFERLSTFAVHQLSESLFTGGIDGLLSLQSQETVELNFWEQYVPNTQLVPHEYNDIKTQIDFKGSHRLYYEEIFFHIPFLIANKLNSNQKFEEAQKWYHYTFNPTANDEAAGNGSSKDRYWRYLPFKEDRFQSLKTLLTDSEALAAYREDPFDPHAIAALRMSAYKKAVVMKYIDNLLDWGDSLFMQDSRESINESVGLYVLAFNLLGPRPRVKTIKRFEEIGTYDDFILDYQEDSEFLTEIEKIVSGSGATAVPGPHRNIITDFCVPENEKFIGYWDLVEDRLYKIRHSQNFEGIYRQLALFSPPINPSDLVAAMASGGGIGGALSDLNVAVPHYRYPIVVAMAREMAGNAIGLGSSLLDAIEKRDSAKLELLQNTHERIILNLTTDIKENEITHVEEAIDELNISKERCTNRRDHYDKLIDTNLIPAEKAELALSILEQVFKAGKSAFEMAAAIASGTPTAEIGGAGLATPVLVTQWGGSNLAEALGHTSEVLDILAELAELGAHVSEKSGEYERRREEWKLERATLNYDLEEIEVQISGAKIELKNAERELTIHLKTIEQNKDIDYFYRSRFSNEALYNWMIGRLSSLYFQSYKTAYDMAKSAEKCLQYEIPSTDTYITSTHWDSLRKGLLAGEALLLQIDQMDKSHLAQDSRFIEIERTISLKNSFPGSLLLLMAKGACEFQLKEALFDRDYSGHYFRVIKTIELTIVTQRELEPYQSVNVTLIQLSNKTLLTPDINGVKYLMGQDGSEQPDTKTLRVNWRANQQVAVSRVNERDAGMFYMDFIFDNRYFPFEGTGLVSSWRLEIPQASNPDLVDNKVLDIDDVLIHIRYTAKSERGRFKTDVEKLLR